MLKKIKCPFCGEEIEENAEKCPHCDEMFVKDCPFCGEKIKIDAIKCKHCSEWLKSTEEPSNNSKKQYKNLIIKVITNIIWFIAFILLAISLYQQFVKLDEVMYGNKLTREYSIDFDKMGTFTFQWQENGIGYGKLILKDTYLDDIKEKSSLNYSIIARLEYPDGRIISKDKQPIPYDKNYIDFNFGNMSEEEVTDISNGEVQIRLKEDISIDFDY